VGADVLADEADDQVALPLEGKPSDEQQQSLLVRAHRHLVRPSRARHGGKPSYTGKRARLRQGFCGGRRPTRAHRPGRVAHRAGVSVYYRPGACGQSPKIALERVRWAHQARAAPVPHAAPPDRLRANDGRDETVCKMTISLRAGVVYSVLALLVFLYLARARSTPSPAHAPEAAYVACQQFVRDRLRAPTSAAFPPYREVVVRGGAPTAEYELRAYVDAQNAFGAPLRSTFTCTVQHTTGTTYRLVDLHLEPR
jgi:hypothetical protein